MNLRHFLGIMNAAVVSLSLLELSPTTAQSFVGGPLNPLNLTRVERGTASAFRSGQTVFQLILPMHLAFDKEKHLCSGFNFHMALQYVQAARLAVDLVENSSLLGNSSIGFMIHDSCNSAERVVEIFAEQTFVSYLQNRQMDFQTFCPNQVGWRRILPLATSMKAVGRLPWFPEYLDPLISIDSYDLVKIARKSCHAFSIPLVTVSSLLPSPKSQLAGVKSYVHSVVPGGAFDVAAIIDLITRLNLTYVGVIARQYDQDALAMQSLLNPRIKNRYPKCLGAAFLAYSNYNVLTTTLEVIDNPFVKTVILLGDLENSLPFIRAVSDLGGIDQFTWIVTSAWGKQVWSLPLDDPEYQTIVQMKHTFFLQPVPASTDSVVGVSWEAIARKLQDRLRNANIQDQTLNPWFKKAWAATLDRVCAVQVDKIKTEEDLGFPDSKPGDSFQGRRTCSLAKHTFTVHNSLILIDAILQAANVLQYADIFCKRWHRGEGCGSRTWFQKEPNGWG